MNANSTLAERELAEFEEKLQNLRSYISAIKERARNHGTDYEHYDDDLMKAENDARYYESEIETLRRSAAGITEPPPPRAPLLSSLPVKTDRDSLIQTGLAALAGLCLGLLVRSRRD